MERFELQAEIKEIQENGTFNGVASVYGVEDSTGDIIDKGAFKKTLSENPAIPVLWQHDSREVIGRGTVKEWQNKILIEGSFDLEDPTALKAYKKLKGGLIKGLSIGFQTIKSTWEEVENRMVRHITELKLWEVSVVTFPALPDAQVTRVKSEDKDLQARVQELEAQIKALKAPPPPAEGTPKEPPKAEEPQEQASHEPAMNHSGLEAIAADVRRALQL